MISWNPRCYIPSFKEIGPLVLEKIFEGFLPSMGMAAILVMRPESGKYIFIFFYLIAYIQNIIEKGPVIFDKSKFIFSKVNDLRPKVKK